MQAYWLNKEGNESIIVFMLGWASDHIILDSALPKGYDAVCIYDYRDIDRYMENGVEEFFFDNDIRPESYAKSCLIAWSFGVWAAEMLFKDIEFDKAVAFNGTPFPVHDTYGIPPRVMDVTIRGLARGGMEAFNQKTYGEYYSVYSDILCPDETEEYVAELKTLSECSRKPYTPSIQWDKAVIGTEDKIFPVENMTCYWNGLAELLPLYHFPFISSEIISKQIG